MAWERRAWRADVSSAVGASGKVVLLLGEAEGGRVRIWKAWICERGMIRYAPAGALNVSGAILEVVLGEAAVLSARRLVVRSAV